MLIYEDFQDSGMVQADLKKVGFDVVVTNNMARLSDQILTFNPDAIISCGTMKMPSLFIGQELKKVTHYRGKSILILPAGDRPPSADLAKARVDILIEAPVQPQRLLEILAKVLSLDPLPLLEKFQKSKILEHAPPPTPRTSADPAPVSQMITVKGAPRFTEVSQISDKERVAGYQKFLQGINIDVHQTSHSKMAVRGRQDELKKGWDFKILEKLDILKRQFAEALFRKNK